MLLVYVFETCIKREITVFHHHLKKINVRENRRGQSRMDNPEKLATTGYTTHRTKVRENRRGQSKFKNGQSRETGNNWVHKTQDEDKQDKKHNTEN